MQPNFPQQQMNEWDFGCIINGKSKDLLKVMRVAVRFSTHTKNCRPCLLLTRFCLVFAAD